MEFGNYVVQLKKGQSGNNMSYTPLHVHTEYSIRDSCLRQTDYIKKVKELNLYAACISDHGERATHTT